MHSHTFTSTTKTEFDHSNWISFSYVVQLNLNRFNGIVKRMECHLLHKHTAYQIHKDEVDSIIRILFNFVCWPLLAVPLLCKFHFWASSDKYKMSRFGIIWTNKKTEQICLKINTIGWFFCMCASKQCTPIYDHVAEVSTFLCASTHRDTAIYSFVWTSFERFFLVFTWFCLKTDFSFSEQKRTLFDSIWSIDVATSTLLRLLNGLSSDNNKNWRKKLFQNGCD